MIQRLLFYGINTKAAAASVSGQDDAVPAVLAHKTKPALPIAKPAQSRAEVALNPPVSQPVPPLPGHDAGFNERSWIHLIP